RCWNRVDEDRRTAECRDIELFGDRVEADRIERVGSSIGASIWPSAVVAIGPPDRASSIARASMTEAKPISPAKSPPPTSRLPMASKPSEPAESAFATRVPSEKSTDRL